VVKISTFSQKKMVRSIGVKYKNHLFFERDSL